MSRNGSGQTVDDNVAEMYRLQSEMIARAWCKQHYGQDAFEGETFIPIHMHRLSKRRYGMSSQDELYEENTMFRHAVEAIYNSIVDEEFSKAQPVLIILRGLDGSNIRVQHWKSLVKRYHGIIDFHIAFYLDKQRDGGFTKALNLWKLVDQKATKSEDGQLVLGR
ncbi:hypothetical protein C1H76_5368 [Elsinoe australis]|uniref:Uncharacterized protein n=1 Tax=Elsinoe australis TaxID=40998 RepID=A0A4U7AZ49_9PEZI|nr:hypothetical protein C1H76_5368 [Elsinoe australis]